MELSGVSAAGGDAVRADELLSEARGVIEQIADSIDDAELRSSFLGLPEVRAVTSG